MPENTFTCTLCDTTYECEWSDEEAAAEYQRDFVEGKAGLYEEEDLADPEMVCHSCYVLLKPYIDAFDAMIAAEKNA